MNRSNATPIVVLCICCGLGSSASEAYEFNRKAAVEDEEFSHVATEEIAAEVDRLIVDLSDPVFATRNAATERLIEISAPALTLLREAYLHSDDFEVRLRIEEIVSTIFFDYHVYNRHGFLGVSLRAYNPGWERHAGPVVPEGVKGVFLEGITDNTAADRAGLLEKDVIIAIDGEPLQGAGQLLTEYVAARVRAHRPGTPMMVTVIRGKESLDIEVILGRCSIEMIRRTRIIGIPELLAEAKSKFPGWWTRNFRAAFAGDDGGREK